MAANDGYRRYVEAAAVLGQITRARAEEIMREMMSGGDVSRAQAQEWVDEMADRSRKATEGLVDMIRSEVTNQMEALGIDPEKLARQAADILRRSAEAGRRVMEDVAQQRRGGRAGAPAPAPAPAPKKAAAKKAAPGRAAAAKKTAAKKSAPTGAAAKNSAPRKTVAVAAAGKKAGGKKAAAKKSASTRPAATRRAPSSAAKKRGGGTTP